MRKSILIIFITVFLGMLTLLAQPKARHIIFTGIIHFPEFAFMQSMKGGLVTRDFDRVLPWLYRQYDLANSYGGQNNRLTPGLLENVKKAYEVAVLREERERFIDLLEKVYFLNPRHIDINIMLASAYQFKDVEKSLSYLDKAMMILPSDQRIFQLANIIVRKSSDTEDKKAWCAAYKSAQFGDYKESKSSTLLGIGFRRLALEFSKDNVRDLFLNEGVQLGERTKYEFILGGQNQLISPSLRLAVGGGLEVSFHNIQLYSEGRLFRSYKEDAISLYPETGYFIDGSVISMNPRGENIFFELPGIVDHLADKVVIEATIKKLALNNSTSCDS